MRGKIITSGSSLRESWRSRVPDASMPKEEKERIGTTESLVRLSVGMEYVENLVTDLSHALAQV